jgi:hypothetical protein
VVRRQSVAIDRNLQTVGAVFAKQERNGRQHCVAQLGTCVRIHAVKHCSCIALVVRLRSMRLLFLLGFPHFGAVFAGQTA